LKNRDHVELAELGSSRAEAAHPGSFVVGSHVARYFLRDGEAADVLGLVPHRLPIAIVHPLHWV
jgi:hypothetical protein